MSQNSDTKMYAALGILALLGGAYFMQVQSKERDAADHSIEGETQKAPELALSEDATKKITKIVLENPATEGDKPKPAYTNVLVKEGDTWKVQEPVKALANQKNVESLLDNLTKLEFKEQVSSSKDAYEKYEVDDKNAVHAVFYEGDKVVREIWAGKSGGRGQMARVDGTDGVIILGGYSGYLYSRDTKAWRDLSILELDPEEATVVKIENENGEYVFTKDGEEWKSKKSIEGFDTKKVENLVNAYKKLNASGFGDDKTLAETGLEQPKATLTIERGEASPIVVKFGENAEGSSRWAVVPGNDQIYSISSWASDWAFADDEKFKKTQKAEDDGDDPGPMPGGMPPGMMMPSGHP